MSNQPTKENEMENNPMHKLQPYFYENWSPELKKLAIPMTASIPIPKAIVEKLVNQDTKDLYIYELSKTMEDSKPFFVKLSSRSPKDFLCIGRIAIPTPVKTPPEVFESFACSMRTHEDLVCFLEEEITPYIHLQAFRPIDELSEYRLFVKGGKLVAMSQYYFQIVNNLTEFEAKRKLEIASAYIGRHSGLFPAKDIVVDVFFNPFNNICLIEINPYGTSDPCLFGNYDRIEALSECNQTAIRWNESQTSQIIL